MVAPKKNGIGIGALRDGQPEDMPREGRRCKRQFFFGLLQHGNGKDRKSGIPHCQVGIPEVSPVSPVAGTPAIVIRGSDTEAMRCI